MKRTNKKGFTIVELVIVIAVIAILAAVLIPNISRLVQKANTSADESLVRNLNTALSMDVEKHTTMSAALKAAKDNGGYDLETIELKGKGNKILWDSVNDCFVYLKGAEKVYLPNTQSVKKAKDMKDYEYFEIVKKVPEAAEQKYSIYLAGSATIETVIVSVGFDVGNNTVASLTYENKGANATAQDVVIRTNGGDLTVDAPVDHIEHYGMSSVVTVKSIGENTFVEHGSVAKLVIEANAKHVVIEKTSVVSNVKNENSTLQFENKGYVVKAEDSSNKVVASTGAIKVYTYEQFQALALGSTMESSCNGKEIELQNDIDMTNKPWIPFGYSYGNSYYGTINGNGHNIIGLSNIYTDTSLLPNFAATSSGVSGKIFGLIAVACAEDNAKLTIKNITLKDVNISGSDLKGAAALVGVFGDKNNKTAAVNVTGTFENIKVTGSISGKDKIAGFIGGASHNGNSVYQGISGHIITFTNCSNEASITADNTDTTARSAGFVGQFGDGQSDSTRGKYEYSDPSTLTFSNCKNVGKIKAKTTSNNDSYAGAFVAHKNLFATQSTLVTITVNSDCISNIGDLTSEAPSDKTAYKFEK